MLDISTGTISLKDLFLVFQLNLVPHWSLFDSLDINLKIDLELTQDA